MFDDSGIEAFKGDVPQNVNRLFQDRKKLK